jgi:alpha-galactosidase
MNRLFFTVLFLITGFILHGQEPSQIAATPPMGWNSWNCFRTNINEDKIKAMADAMVHSGMKEAGYQYIVIDDGWMTKQRDSSGHIIVNPEKFPNGIKAVADYVHSKGLKFGIYSSPGCFTCQNKYNGIQNPLQHVVHGCSTFDSR